MPEDCENREHLDLGAVVLRDVRLDSTVERVPAHIVYRIIWSSYTGFLRFPLSPKTQCERAEFGIDSVAKK
jgi:hypothetical protein